MTSLYSHNHYNQSQSTRCSCSTLLTRLPSISPRAAQISASLYFLILFFITLIQITIIDYGLYKNLHYYQICYVIFFALIILILIASTIRQRFCDGYIVQIPLWLLGMINAIIFCIGFVPLFGGVEKGSSSIIYFAYFTALFNQFTLAVIVIYTIYKVCFMTNSNGNNNNNNNLSFFGFNNDPIGGGNHYYSRDHRQYALAATGELDADSDIELELDLYSSGLNDSYQPYMDSADGYYENDDQNKDINKDNNNTNNKNNGSIKGKKQQDFASLNSLGSGNSGGHDRSGGRDITIKTKNSSSGMMNAPNFDINLGDEYTDVE